MKSMRFLRTWPLLLMPFMWCAAFTPSASQAAPSPRIYRDTIRPEWFGDRFWYRVSTGPGTHEFILVDAAQGTRHPAFDHQRMSEALTQAGVSAARADALPMERLDFESERGSVRFRSGLKHWSFNLESYALVEVKSETPDSPDESDQLFTRTESTGEEINLRFHNGTDRKLKLFWLTFEGQQRSYGSIDPGDSREQHTFAGHVWLLTDEAGTNYGTFRASESTPLIEVRGPSRHSLDQGRKRRPQPEPDQAPRGAASPDGKWTVLATNRNVVLRAMDSGREIPLTRHGTPENGYNGQFFWSPDSRWVVALCEERGEGRKVYMVESSPADQLQPKLHSFEYLKPGDKVDVTWPRLFEVPSGREVPLDKELFSKPWSLSEFGWAPDGSSFRFLYNERGHQLLRLVAVQPASGETRTVLEERAATFVNYSGKFFLQYSPGGERLIWMSERDGWNHLYLYDARKGELLNQVTQGEWVVRSVEQVDWEKGQVWFRAGGVVPGQDPYYVHYGRVNLDGAGLVWLTEGDGTHRVEFSPDRVYVVDRWSRVDQAPVIELRRGADGRRVCLLEEADTRELQASGWRAPERFMAPGRDGVTPIYGVIHWPKDFDPARKYPVIESIYAGPQDSFVPKSFQTGYSQRKLADRGFIVVEIDGMGTSNRSKKFHDVCWKNLGDSGFPDRIAWMRAAAARHPAMDLARVGIYGTSAGGQSALRGLLAHPEFYHAGVADCGCHDNRMDKIWWNEQWMGYPVGPHYAEQSNVTQAHRLQGKLLLAVGELDRNVDPASTMQVVNALIKADKDFELFLVPGAGHGLLGMPYVERRMIQFFERHLRP